MQDYPIEDNLPCQHAPVRTNAGPRQPKTGVEQAQSNYRAYHARVTHWIVRIFLGRTMLMECVACGTPLLARAAQFLDLPELAKSPRSTSCWSSWASSKVLW